jgi:hypothetical protein
MVGSSKPRLDRNVSMKLLGGSKYISDGSRKDGWADDTKTCFLSVRRRIGLGSLGRHDTQLYVLRHTTTCKCKQSEAKNKILLKIKALLQSIYFICASCAYCFESYFFAI